MAGPSPVLAHTFTRGLLVAGTCWLTFGPFPALVATVSALALVPYEAWSRARTRWGARCAAVLFAWPLAAGVAVATIWQTVYTAEVMAHGGESARFAASQDFLALPADPSPLSAFEGYLQGLPWHRSYAGFDSHTILETAALLATVLTLVSFGAVFLAGQRSPLSTERALQTICAGVGAAVIGLAWYQSHALVPDYVQLDPPPPLRPDPFGLWAYGVLVGSACPLAGVIADWLLELQRAPEDPCLRSASPDAAPAPG